MNVKDKIDSFRKLIEIKKNNIFSIKKEKFHLLKMIFKNKNQ